VYFIYSYILKKKRKNKIKIKGEFFNIKLKLFLNVLTFLIILFFKQFNNPIKGLITINYINLSYIKKKKKKKISLNLIKKNNIL